ncbi:MAG: protein-tyrosine phosphatase family protein [Chitinophagales bacterium]
MPLYKIPIVKDFYLYTMPAPRQEEDLLLFFKELKVFGVNHVVNLLDNKDIVELSLQDESLITHSVGLNYSHFPIEDYSFPKDKFAFISLAQKLKKEVLAQQIIAIHCRAGIGRSSLLAAAILASFSFPKEELFQHISKHRGCAVPDKQEQASQLLDLYKELAAL